MSAAAGTLPPPEWFLARDGEQFGPLSDVELRKLVEFGHLKPTDLLWREGFPDWRPARILLPETAGPPPVVPVPAAAAAPSQPTHQPAPVPVAPQSIAVPVAAPRPEPAPVAPMVAQPPATAPVRTASVAPSRAPAPSAPAPAPAAYQPPAAAPQRYAPTAAPMPAPLPPGPITPVATQPVLRPAPAPAPVNPYTPPPRAPDPTPPLAAAPVAKATRQARAAPVHRSDEDDDDYADVEEGSRVVVWIKRIAVLLFFSLTLSAAAWYAYPYRTEIAKTLGLASIGNPLGAIGGGASPVTGFKPSGEATDEALQKSKLWQVLKRDFPDWYVERLKEASSLATAQKGDAEIGRHMLQQVIALRRKHAGDALAATMPRLKSLASAFAENLVRLRQVSVEACHTFVSNGETAADYLRLLADPSHARVLEAQLVAVFEAIADGRKVPRIYPQPKQADYDLLVTALEARGWKDDDMRLFSDSRRFGQAAPEKVCQMVTDWFKAQIDLKDPDAQLRLLADALKPVVAG